MLYKKRVLFFSLSVARELKCLQPSFISSVGENGRLLWQEDEQNDAISAPKFTDFFPHLFRNGLTWCTIGIYRQLFQLFLELYCVCKALKHPVISKLMHHSYLQSPPACKCFYALDVEHLLSSLKSWEPASSLNYFELTWRNATF